MDKKDNAITQARTDDIIHKLSMLVSGGEIKTNKIKLKEQLFLYKLYTLHKPNLHSPADIQATIDNYFTLSMECNIDWNVSSLAIALGITRTELLNYANGNDRMDIKKILQEALQVIEASVSNKLTGYKANAVALNTILQNDFNFINKNYTKENTSNEVLDDISDEDLKNKYL